MVLKKKQTIILIMLFLILLSGCTSHEVSSPKFFDDTGNSVSNIEECVRLYEQKWSYYTINKIVCDSGKCYCD